MVQKRHSSKFNVKRTEDLRALVQNLPVKRVIDPCKAIRTSDLIEEGPYASLIREQGLQDALPGLESYEGSDY
jgi:hypothetical protein